MSPSGYGAPIVALCCATALGGCDTITLQNANGTVGVLVDGASGGVVNDRGRVGGAGATDVTLNVGALESAAAPNRNEAIGFGRRRRPVRSDTPWTDGDDSFDLPLPGRLNIPVTVWVVQGPFAAQRDHAIEACIQTAAIWDDERAGVRFSAFDIKNATNDPDIDDAILNSTGGDNRNWDDFSDEIGFDEGRVNIYWIDTVDGSTSTGWSDFGARIVMGRDTGDELLAHELGHAFSLRHPVGCGGASSDFDTTNVMWPCSSVREFLSEGQVFRIHFNTTSSANALYAARPGEPTEDCINAGQSAECPALERRIWDDGSFLNNN